MATESVIIAEYSRDAINTLRDIFSSMNQGGASNSTGSGSSNPTGTADDNTEAVEDNTDAVRRQSKSFDTLKKSTGQLKKSFASFKSAASQMAPLLNEFKSGVAGGVEAVDGFAGYADRFKTAYVELGISITSLHEFNKTARAASINLGGFDAWAGKLAEKQSKYYALTGDLTAATKFQVEMQNTLIHSGGKATDLYDTFGDRLDTTNIDLLKMGVSLEESATHVKEFTSDESTRQRLMSAVNGQQRKQIILEMQGRFKNLKMMGMSTEQAKAASKALEELSGKGPLDRFKQAAKAQAGMSAMGIDNAAEVANIIRKGDRASEEERGVVRKAMGQMQEISAESRTGGMGGEFFMEAIMSKTGLDQLPNVFSEKLGEGAAVNQEQLDAIKMLGKDTPKLTAIASFTEKISNFLSTSWIASIGGIALDIGASLALAMTAFGGGGLLAKMGASMKKLVPTGVGGGMGKGKGMGKNMMGGALAGAAAAAAAYGIQQAYQAITTGESDVSNLLTDAFPNAMATFGDWMGKGVDSVTSLWNKEDAKRIETAAKIAKLEEARIKKSQEKEKANESNSVQLSHLYNSITKMNQELATANESQQAALRSQIEGSRQIIGVLEDSLGIQRTTARNTDNTFAGEMKGTPET